MMITSKKWKNKKNKPMKKLIKSTAILIGGFLLIISCVRVRGLSYEQNQRKSKPDTYQVEILESDKIEKNYKVIGEVSADGPNYRTDKIMEKLRSEVREMGGDAIIEFETGTAGVGVINNGTGTYNEDAKQVFKAKVIVWTE